GRDERWNGAWNGFFGLNQFNADQEVFYVMDDWTNREFQFYPFGQNEPQKRGLGVQIDVRLFQWSQALAKDILFMQYEVSNVGDVVYSDRLDDNPIFFGGYTDTNPSGSGATDDAAAFDRFEDIVYGWSFDGIGLWTQFREIPPGWVGWKFLESPSISFDGIDNDSDGLTDESRDNPAGNFIFGPCGIYGESRDHWEGDEDCDWNERIDDKGTDGIGPDEDGYPGPDPDGTEGNGRPDQGEPNFGKLDKDESDQVGLTSFNAPLFGTIDIKDEENMWSRMQPGFFDVPQQAVNQIWIFASGPFTLLPNRTERFSTCFLWGANEDAMFRTAKVAQRIFDADYRFARPPRQPELSAVPGDGKVTLIWDDLSELSRDPIYGRDFEGYRIIKSTDPQFRDAVDVTDAFGNAVYKQALAQFDKVNGLTGPHPLQFGEEIDLPNGVHFYMGNDNGLAHSFVDENVVNGRTYYYAVLSYDAGYDVDFFDRGISEIDKLFPISPSESPGSITVTNGVITKYDRNTVAVTPNPPPSDVEPGFLQTDEQDTVPLERGFASGRVSAVALSAQILRDATYDITFEDEPLRAPVEFTTANYTITDDAGTILANRVPIPQTVDGLRKAVWTHELLEEGIVLLFENAVPSEANTQQNSDWTFESQTNLFTTIEATPTFTYPEPPIWPINVVIEVFDPATVVDTALVSTFGGERPTSFKVYEEGTERPLDFVFTEPRTTRDGKIDTTEAVQLVFKNAPTDTRFIPAWTIRFNVPVDAGGAPLPPEQVVLPQPGDRYVLRSEIPFGERDLYSFSSVAARVTSDAGESLLDRIVVVP
ncbi:MAG: hypothetical protein R3178_04525, partial [Rhodothermales bacterium]|nr:hypothetical protein [Rhodothermales bacterium]